MRDCDPFSIGTVTDLGEAPPPLILGKKEGMTEEKRPAGQVNQRTPAPLPLAQGLDLPLWQLCWHEVKARWGGGGVGGGAGGSIPLPFSGLR